MTLAQKTHFSFIHQLVHDSFHQTEQRLRQCMQTNMYLDPSLHTLMYAISVLFQDNSFIDGYKVISMLFQDNSFIDGYRVISMLFQDHSFIDGYRVISMLFQDHSFIDGYIIISMLFQDHSFIHVYQRTVVSVSQHYTIPTQRVGLVQSGPRHHLIEN